MAERRKTAISVAAGVILFAAAYFASTAAAESSRSVAKLEEQIKEKKGAIIEDYGIEAASLRTATLALKLPFSGSDNDLPFFDGKGPSGEKVAEACNSEIPDQLRAQACGIANTALERVSDYQTAVGNSDIPVYQKALTQEQSNRGSAGWSMIFAGGFGGYFLKGPVMRSIRGAGGFLNRGIRVRAA